MQVINLKVGYLSTNCYILIKDKECLIIDPGDNYELISQKTKNYHLRGILITHYHEDHIMALSELLTSSVPIYDYQTPIKKNEIGLFHFEIIDTKGHTDDSVTFYFKKEKIMFTGDFLFKGSIGRYDFPSSSAQDMKKSINLIKKYDQDILIYPGHGEKTNLKFEINNNYYLKQ